MTHPATITPDPTGPADRTPRTWVYWFAYITPGGYYGNTAITSSAPITHMELFDDIRAAITQASGHPDPVVISFTLLRVENAAGQVIG